jgi:phosphoglycerol transferase MdoB-like AlkP superfamily enzyme
MQIENNILPDTKRNTLKDFIPLIFAFFGGLIALSIYQNVYLYVNGVLDGFLNKSLFLLLVHHTGYTALVALLLSFLFNYLEEKKPELGLKIIRVILLALLIIEGLLIAYYVQNYDILGVGIFGISGSDNIRFFLLPIFLMLLLTALIFHFLHKRMASFYQIISRMYPFTIILFGLFLATLNSDKKPINQNKTQYLVSSIAGHLFDFNSYEGVAEYPLQKAYQQKDVLGSYFNLSKEKPNIVFLIVEGLGSDFIGKNARFKGFTPFLDSLQQRSLYWENFVGNTGASFASFPTIMGSLPFGENGFTNIDQFTNRHTLYSILKKNGYATSFNYGGNSALNHFDKFLDEERVDIIIDKNSFDEDYQLQNEDAAGISLGYPDGELFKKWAKETYTYNAPTLDVFYTLSSKNPYLIPEKEKYENLVEKKIKKSILPERSLKLIKNNREIFASLLYTDEQLEKFLRDYQRKESYNNTIFVITGSHSNSDLPQNNELDRYRVPFMIYSPTLISPKKIASLASHADIAPSIVSLLDQQYQIKIPAQVSWLGDALVSKNTFRLQKHIPLFRGHNNIQDFITGNHYLTSGKLYKLDNKLNLLETDDDAKEDELKANFKYFKSVNTYVTTQNKILPESESLLATRKVIFSKTEMIWVESVFNGKDIDKAYNTARQLAFDKDWNRSLLLCKYILSKTPRHADTEILMGRVYSWQKEYIASEEALKEVIRQYPKYAESYAALLDTYYWADTNEKSIVLLQIIARNAVKSIEIDQKLTRAKKQLAKKKITKETIAGN